MKQRVFKWLVPILVLLSLRWLPFFQWSSSHSVQAAGISEVVANFDSRKDHWIDLLEIDGEIDERFNQAHHATLLLDRVKRGYYSGSERTEKIELANQILMKVCRAIDEPDYKGMRKGVYEGHSVELLRVYLLYKDHPDLLYPETTAKLLDGTEPADSGYPSNPKESLRFFDEVVYSKGWGVGISYRNPWTCSPGGTENHDLAMAVTGILISQIYEGQNYTAPDGTFPFKDNTPAPDDYYHYWLDGFYNWVERYEKHTQWGDENRDHLAQGCGEKDSKTYVACYLAYFWLLRDFCEDEPTAKLTEVLIDLWLADWAEDNLGGMYTGYGSRSYGSPIYHQRENNLAVAAYLLFDNLPKPINHLDQERFIYNWCGWLYTAIATSDYRPGHPKFPNVLVDIAVNKPSAGYMSQSDMESNRAPKFNFVAPHWALGFRWRWSIGGQDNFGGLWINSLDNEAVVCPYIGDEVGSSHVEIGVGGRGLVAGGVGVYQIADVENSAYPHMFYIPDKIDGKIFQEPWVFLREPVAGGREVYVALRTVRGGYSTVGPTGHGVGYRCDYENDAVLYEVADSDPLSPWYQPSFSDFRADVLNNPFSFSGGDYGWIDYTSSTGVAIRFHLGAADHLVNGVQVDWHDFDYVINNPYMVWKMGERKATFSRGDLSARYDFADSKNVVKTVENATSGPMMIRELLLNWLSSSPNPARADANSDGKVNGVDFGYIVRDWSF